MRQRSDGTIVRVARSAILECSICCLQMSGVEVLTRVFRRGRCHSCNGTLWLISTTRKIGGKYQ